MLGLILATAAYGGLANGSSAQAEIPFEDGEVISLIVPYGPGGGFDRVLRLIQPHFEEALNDLAGEGTGVTVLVENMPGAGGRVSYEHVYSAEPDGTQLVLLGDQGAALQQVALGAGFDLNKFSYIALVNNSDWGILVRNDLGINSMKEFIERAKETPILFGSSGAGSGDHIASLLLQAMLEAEGVELPIEHAHFDSSASVFASMQRGEAEAYIGSVESTLPAVNEGFAKIISVFSDERSDFFPDVQTTVEEGIPGAERINSAIGISRALLGPPELPPDVLSTLRDAAETALQDPDLIAAAEAAELPIQYASGDQAKTTVLGHGAVVIEFADLVKEVVN
jgi:tripartite-type tricarboxylate transporter receptor subunit TctC